MCLVMEVLPCSLKHVLYGRENDDSRSSSTQFSTRNFVSSSGADSSHVCTSRQGSIISESSADSVRLADGIIRLEQRLSMAQLLHVGRCICSGLAYLHDQTMSDTAATLTSEILDVLQGTPSSKKIVHRGEW